MVTGRALVRAAVPRVSQGTSSLRKDIQALRALAVGLVVLNHLWPHRLQGGYVGVDVFFVISGYLITKHLLGELERTGRIRLGQFYSRRIKRLLPAAFLVSVVSLVAAWVFLPFSRWFGIAQETMAAVLYVENWTLAAKSVNYSAHNDAASTVQHYWSLSVEEQFYLVWPLLLVGLFLASSRLRLRRRSLLAIGVTLVSVASLAFCIWFTYTNSSQAYFVTPGRIWEFGVGALVAVAGWKGSRALSLKPSAIHLTVAGLAQWTGFGLIVLAAFLYDGQTPFPGIAASVPVVGTLLVIASGPKGPRWSPNRIVAARPVQFVGDVSYSLYLWHWPLIVVAPAIVSHTLGTVDKAVILALAVGAAFATKKFVEDPGRSKLLPGASPGRVFGAMAAAVVVVSAVCGGLVLSLGQVQDAEAAKLQGLAGQPCYGARSLDPQSDCRDRFGPAQVDGVGPNETPWFNAPECKLAADPIVVQDRTLLTECDFTEGAKPSATVWLVGDSHGEQWKTAIYEMAKLRKWTLKESLLGGCPFIDAKRVAFMGVQSAEPQLQQRCLEWGRKLTERISVDKPDMIFAAAFGAEETVDDGTGRSQSEQYNDGVTKRLHQWADSGSEIFVLRDTPLTLHRSSPDCVALNKETPLLCANALSEALVADPIADAALGMSNPKINVLDLSDQFCAEQTCHAVIGGLPVYYDMDHVSRSYMHSLVPVLSERWNKSRQ
ncbi:MAG: SGNH hydrolase domain-containing protein [Pseudarthrobacter sp.]